MTMSAILADIGLIVTDAVSWGGEFITFITSHPIVLLCVIFPFVGYGVHLVKMLLRR